MMRVWFVRHGETEWNRTKRYQGHSDIALNERGRRQAQEAAQALAAEPLQAVYSSDLVRAVETARAVAAPHGLEVRTLPGLRELHFGLWEGLRYEEIMARWPEQLQQLYDHPESGEAPEGEGFAALAGRAWAALADISRRHGPDEAVAVVAHGGTIRVLLCLLRQWDLGRLWELSVEHAAALPVEVPARGDVDHLRL